ncbi:MAG: LacI family transcriptional regulator [Propionibacteriaceae bacterium]|jgi:DNA-binding LacI/PurR family transcriptional regulator|nr:LacI family transcriptional regulator [Propionibacteriaceae bacterium]
MAPRPPSILDVAELAKVSRQTVSRVLNEHPSVNPETRQRVLDAIAQLDYRRNPAAHALASKHSNILGVTVTNAQLLGPSGALLAIDEAARLAGYWVSVAFVRGNTEQEMDSALSHFLNQGAEGAIVIAPNDATLAAVERNADRLPMVLATTADTSGLGIPALDIDQRAGAHKAVQHLIELGHERIAHISGPLNEFHARDRLAQWSEDLRAAGLSGEQFLEGDWSPASGYQFGCQIAAEDNPPTGIFAASDQMAMGLLRALQQHGIRVPQDISVVGFDNMVGSDQLIPPLTTVEQRFDELGAALLSMLVALVDGKEIPRAELVPELIVRESTAARS